VLTTDRLIELAWEYEGGDAFAAKTHISHIRQKLGITTGQLSAFNRACLSVPAAALTLDSIAPTAGAPQASTSPVYLHAPHFTGTRRNPALTTCQSAHPAM
jgi:hypothetical protein